MWNSERQAVSFGLYTNVGHCHPQRRKLGWGELLKDLYETQVTQSGSKPRCPIPELRVFLPQHKKWMLQGSQRMVSFLHSSIPDT
jgi:hypothetical protein